MGELWVSPTRTIVCDTASMECKDDFFKLRVGKLGNVMGLYDNKNGISIPIEVECDPTMPELAVTAAEILHAEMEPQPEHISLVGYTPELVRVLEDLNPIFNNVKSYPWVETGHKKYDKSTAGEGRYFDPNCPIVVTPHCLNIGVRNWMASTSKLSIVFMLGIIPYEENHSVLESIREMRKKSSFAAWWIHEWSPSMNYLATALIVQQEVLPAQVIHRRQPFPKFFNNFERQLREACHG